MSLEVPLKKNGDHIKDEGGMIITKKEVQWPNQAFIFGVSRDGLSLHCMQALLSFLVFHVLLINAAGS